MKVAVSSLGTSLDDRVDDHFGRARYFVIADTDSDTGEAVDNATNMNALQGAGIAAAETVSDHGATAVITGHLGPKAFAALKAAEIPGYNGSGMTVRSAVAAFAAGELPALTEAGEAHAG
ncbi:MAG: NifB/NifX family molybdenum-iron cluster-binding protein [Coriobacteriia bacterium]|nr:NifB/NifX family molybdenum-iron cluster-binding protein [Coriobacteriia bacterium]